MPLIRAQSRARVALDIVSPFEGPVMALVTVARVDVLWQRRIVLPAAGVTFQVPITAKMIPSARVQVVVVDGLVSEIRGATPSMTVTVR